MPPITKATATIVNAIHPHGVSVVEVSSVFFEATAAPAAAAAATVAAGDGVVVVVPTTTVPVVAVTCVVTVCVVVTVTGAGAGVVSVTVGSVWVTVTVVVRTGGDGPASVVAGGSVDVSGVVVVVVREGVESVGMDRVGPVRVPTAS